MFSLRTLSPDNPGYRGSYYSTDSDDPSTAKGANYHQGPSWLWPIGYFLQASIHFGITEYTRPILAAQEDFIKISRMLIDRKLITLITLKAWLGLPELENEGGSECPGSCPIQTWSHSTIIEVLFLLNKI